MPNFMKIRTVTAEFFHADRRRDNASNSRFPQFYEDPEMEIDTVDKM